MNKKDTDKLKYFPKEELDAAVNERFPGAKCTSKYSIFEMTYITTFNKRFGKEKKQSIRIFVEGFLAGHEALSAKMLTK